MSFLTKLPTLLITKIIKISKYYQKNNLSDLLKYLLYRVTESIKILFGSISIMHVNSIVQKNKL